MTLAATAQEEAAPLRGTRFQIQSVHSSVSSSHPRMQPTFSMFADTGEWKTALVRAAHARCCAAEAAGDKYGQLDATIELHQLFAGHRLESLFAGYLRVQRQDLGLPAELGPSSVEPAPARGTVRRGPPEGSSDAEAPRHRPRVEASVPAPAPAAEARPPRPPPAPPPPAPLSPPTLRAPERNGSVRPAPAPSAELSAAASAALAAAVAAAEVEQQQCDDGDDGGVGASQCSQMSECVAPSQRDAFEGYKCAICLNLLHEPITHAACHNSFCRSCYYQAIQPPPNGGMPMPGAPPPARRCPICRGTISLEEAHSASVDVGLWKAIQGAFPTHVAHRREQLRQAAQEAAAAAVRNGGCAPPQAGSAHDATQHALQRDMLRELMQRHRAVLETAQKDYFRRIEVELERPPGELVRCHCLPVRFVALRGRTHSGREFYNCPLRQRYAPAGMRTGCNLWQWVL
jgi:hypothetical protein